MKKCIALSLFSLGLAHAATLELSGGFGVGIIPSSDATLLFGANVSGLNWIPQHDLTLGLTNHRLEASLSRSLSGGPLGFGQAEVGAQLGLGGGFLLKASLNGTLGPIALNAKLEGWTVSRAYLDPMSTLTLDPESTRSADYKVELGGKYRLERNTFLAAVGKLGADSRLEAGIQRQIPGLELRVGGVLGGASKGDLFALTGGLSTRSSETFTLGVDGLLGLNGNDVAYGVRGTASLYGVLPFSSDLNVYGAFEPWRRDSEQVRYGLTTSTSLPAGNLTLELAGSANATLLRARFALEVGGE